MQRSPTKILERLDPQRGLENHITQRSESPCKTLSKDRYQIWIDTLGGIINGVKLLNQEINF